MAKTSMPNLRVRVKKSGKTYYYFDCGGKPRKEIPLGSDYVLAVRKWAELCTKEEAAAAVTNFVELAARYKRDVAPTKAKSTQSTQRSDLKHLLEFFGQPPAPLDEIKPHHIRQLLDWKKDHPTTANRLKRLFSHMFNMARAWGYTEAENPVAGIRGFELERQHDKSVPETVYQAVWEAGSQPFKDAMDLAYLTGQRPGDMLKFNERQIEKGVFVIKKQNKGGTPLRIRIEGEFGKLIERITQRKAGHKVWCVNLAVNEWGMPLTKATLRRLTEEARDQAIKAHPELAAEIKNFWFYDLRGKAADDVSDERGEQAAADLLGHDNVRTTQKHYLTRGRLVGPTK